MQISIGSVRLLYDITFEKIIPLAQQLNPIINHFPPFNGGNLFDCSDKIFKYINEKVKNVNKNIFKQNSFEHISLILPNTSLFAWLVLFSDIDNLIQQAFNESKDSYYYNIINSISNQNIFEGFIPNPSRVTYFASIYDNIAYIMKIALLDCSMVEVEKVCLLLKSEGYASPTRQQFDKLSTTPCAWKEFYELLKYKHIQPLPQGGSRPNTLKIEATRKACVMVANNLSNEETPNGSISMNMFVKKVEEVMRTKGEYDSFQPSAAREYFSSKPKILERVRTKRGRPSKNNKTN